ncbi:MAG: OmpA family protein [Proteobacteria bacterium]|nr:OmpA family protein [Pseudomonadota bacterium]
MKTKVCFFLVAVLGGACATGASPSASTAGHRQSAGEASAAETADASSTQDDAEGAGATRAQSDDEFRLAQGIDAHASGVATSKLAPTATEALLKLIVKKKDGDVPIAGVVVSAANAAGDKFYSTETDAKGYTEMLVPNGAKYTVTYLSMAKSDVNMSVEIPAVERATIQLTMYYSHTKAPPPLTADVPDDDRRLILEGVVFDTAKATLKSESFPHLEKVVEYMKYKPGCRVELSGHTDSVGNAQKNKKLSVDRANAVKKWLVTKGIAADRIEAVGYGQERPIATNDTEEGRATNRRTEAREL